MGDLQTEEDKRYAAMSDFLEQQLPLDLIKYVIKGYIYEFRGERANITSLSNSRHGYYRLANLNDNEFVISSRGLISNYKLKENYSFTQNVAINWGMIDCIALANRKVITAYSDGTISIYDVDLHTEHIHTDFECQVILFIIKLPPNDISPETIVIASSGAIYRLEIPTLRQSIPQCVRINDGYETAITSLIACNDGNVAFAGADLRIQIWNPYTQTLMQVLSGHDDWIAPLLTCPDSNFIVSVGYDNTIKAWNPITGLVAHSMNSNALAFITVLANNKIAASTGSYINIYNILTGKLLNTINHGSKIDYLLKTLDDKLVALTRYNSACVYNMEGQLLMTLGTDNTNSIKILENGKIITTHTDESNYDSAFINVWK